MVDLRSVITFIVNTIGGTPLWVWAALAYLLFVGIRATKSRTVYPPKLFIIPIILVCLSIRNLLYGSYHAWAIYGLAMIGGGFFGYALARHTRIEQIASSKQIRIPGSYQTLVLLIVFFAVKYVFGYLKATSPDTFLTYASLELLIGGLFSGLFFGRNVNYVLRSKR